LLALSPESPFHACDLRFAESGCGVGPSPGCFVETGRGVLVFLPKEGAGCHGYGEGRPCGNWSSVGVEREYVLCDVDDTNEVVGSVVMN